jgi:REP element-mobilizing transposase RayT
VNLCLPENLAGVCRASTKSFRDTIPQFISSPFARIAVNRCLATERTHFALVQFAQCAVDFNVAVGRYVIMPDHVHLFVGGHIEFELGRWIGALKQSIMRANDWSKSDGQIWQEGFFDHILRNDDSMSQKWEYVVQNPVRARLVTNPEDWRYQGEIVVIDRV